MNRVYIVSTAIIFTLFMFTYADARTVYKSSATGRFVPKSTSVSKPATTYKTSLSKPKSSSGGYYYKSAKTGKFTTKSSYKSKPSTTYRARK